MNLNYCRYEHVLLLRNSQSETRAAEYSASTHTFFCGMLDEVMMEVVSRTTVGKECAGSIKEPTSLNWLWNGNPTRLISTASFPPIRSQEKNDPIYHRNCYFFFSEPNAIFFYSQAIILPLLFVLSCSLHVRDIKCSHTFCFDAIFNMK